MLSRRDFFSTAAAGGMFAFYGSALRVAAASSKPMRGIFVIMATPYTAAKDIDYEDLTREVDFLDRAGVQGMVWPQMASEYPVLTRAERMEGMRVLSLAAKGKRPALVLGVQAADTDHALEYARAAEALGPDAMIAMPPTAARSIDDFRRYYQALAGVTKRPFFIQTTGGARQIVPEVEFLAELAREFPNFGYVKEEYQPVVERMSELSRRRPPIRAVFSGNAGRGLLYEMRMGMDGTMPGAPYADVYARIWDLYQNGKQEQARDLFARLLLMINLDQEIPGVRQYCMKRRGIFKTTVSRQVEAKLSREAMAEIDLNLAALRPYFVTNNGL